MAPKTRSSIKAAIILAKVVKINFLRTPEVNQSLVTLQQHLFKKNVWIPARTANLGAFWPAIFPSSYTWLHGSLENQQTQNHGRRENQPPSRHGGDRTAAELPRKPHPERTVTTLPVWKLPKKAPITGLIFIWPDSELAQWRDSPPRALVENQLQLFNIQADWGNANSWANTGLTKINFKRKSREWDWKSSDRFLGI